MDLRKVGVVMSMSICNRLVNAFEQRRKQKIPRIIKMRTFYKKGCKFEISTPIEVFRVEQYGGEEEFTSLILAEIKPDDVFLDIGSCVGLVAVHAARKGARVYAFEPDPYYRSRLAKNLKLNRLKNLTIIEWAVSNGQGEFALFTDGTGGNSPSLRNIGDRGAINVKTDTIDNSILRKEIPTPNIIKLDIEGAEMLALKGMQKLLRSDMAPRSIFMEVHPAFLKHFNSSSDEVIRFIESFGFRKNYFVESHNQIHCIFTKQLIDLENK